jgi:hypothetical protein
MFNALFLLVRQKPRWALLMIAIQWLACSGLQAGGPADKEMAMYIAVHYGVPADDPRAQYCDEADNRKPFDIIVKSRLSLTGEHSLNEILNRFARISSLTDVRYWSVTRQRWRALINSAIALDTNNLQQTRQDFTLDELEQGQTVYFEQDEETPAGTLRYAMRYEASGNNGFQIHIHNAEPVERFFIRLFDPGQYQFHYQIAQKDQSLKIKAINCIRLNSLWLDTRSAESSYANRAQAMLLYLTGEPVQHPYQEH